MSKLQAELAVRALHMGTFAHLEHFKTGSYAAHKALETLYTDLPDTVDSFVEQWQGKHGKIEAYPSWAPESRRADGRRHLAGQRSRRNPHGAAAGHVPSQRAELRRTTCL